MSAVWPNQVTTLGSVAFGKGCPVQVDPHGFDRGRH